MDIGDDMFYPLGVKTDFSILKSLIKIEDYISYAKNNGLNVIGILDDNLNSSHIFYEMCKKNNIKPVIGLDIIIEDKEVYLYPVNYHGLTNLFKFSSLEEKSFKTLKNYSEDIICVINYESLEIYENMKKIFSKVFLSFKTDEERVDELSISEDVIYINETLSLTEDASKYINYLDMINKNITLGEFSLKDYRESILEIKKYDTSKLTDLIDIEFPNATSYIPVYVENSQEYLKNLAIKGLNRRLSNDVPLKYKERLLYELDIISKMGFSNYFLIVFDYVRYAKKNGILIGPGRGSAVSSLVSYSLGITEIDPLKYNLLFERFLNPERITMPDIDIDFEYERVDEVFNYVKEKYGSEYVARIITYGTFQAREAIRTVGKINNVKENLIQSLLQFIDSKKTLKGNLNKNVLEVINRNSLLKKVYKEACVIEGLKKNESMHAAGVVISSVKLTDVIPIIKKSDLTLTGYTMNELESLGLLKMDFLALKNLTIIKNTIRKIDDNFNLMAIPLNDEKVYNLFKEAHTLGIFQFESFGMKSFLKKFKPDKFEDLVLALAVYRPGPMENIDVLCDRKNKHFKYSTFDESLKSILDETYGIIVYQEQIMEILRTMGNYSYAHADIVRRAISKKKIEVMESERKIFIEESIKNGYSKECAEEVFKFIEKFASFGFNKSHSVAYALLAYEMAYLKVNHKCEFYASLLNTNIGGEEKTKEYITEAKGNDIKIIKPSINKSGYLYECENNTILLPFRSIKGISSQVTDGIIKERENGEFKSFNDFLARCYKKIVNQNIVEILIKAGVFDDLGINRKTLITNLNSSITYAELIRDLDSSLVSEPVLNEVDEFDDGELMNMELSLYGFYVTNHLASKYVNSFKQANIKENFDKVVDTVVLVEKIKKIKTKNGDDMAFLEASDETGTSEFTIFKEAFPGLKDVFVGSLVKVRGRVEKRMDKYQIVVSNISKI